MPLSIVLADDDPEFRMIVRYLLASVSDEMALVGEAADGEEALALVLRKQPDVLVSDLVMPRLNGIELTRRVRETSPNTKIILMSSYTDDAYRMMASSSGADAFMNKQMIHSSLVSALRGASRPAVDPVREAQRPHRRPLRPRTRDDLAYAFGATPHRPTY